MPASCVFGPKKKIREKDHHITFGPLECIADKKWLFLFKSTNMFYMDSHLNLTIILSSQSFPYLH